MDVDEMIALLGCVCLSEIPYKDIVSTVFPSNLFSNEVMKETLQITEMGSGGSNPRGLSGILNINMKLMILICVVNFIIIMCD